MAWIPGRFNLSPDRPGPSLHITAAATSLTSFINVSGQPKSRKREQILFPAKSYMPRRYRISGRLFCFFALTDCRMLSAECLDSLAIFGVMAIL